MQFERRLDRKLVFSILAAGILSFTGVVIETAMNVTFPSLMKEFSVSSATVELAAQAVGVEAACRGLPQAISWCWRW